MKNEILNSQTPNQYIIDLAIKYNKYQFKPELYLEKPELLKPISKIEILFWQLANQIKGKNHIEILQLVYNKNYKQNTKLPKFINIKYKKTLQLIY